MQKLSKTECKMQGFNLYNKYIACCGLRNGKMLMWEAYKLFRAEDKRRKDKISEIKKRGKRGRTTNSKTTR